MPNIVQVNVSQTVAPTPSSLQRTAVMISQGATVTTPGTLSLLTQLADLAPLLVGARTLASLTWSSGFANATTAAPHGYATGDNVEITVAGATPAGYNGTFLATITGPSTFAYMVPTLSNATVPGSYTPEDVAELNSMATSFFSQGSSVSVYVLEVGGTNNARAIAQLGAYLTANPKTIGHILVPREWDGDPNFLALLAQYTSTTSLLYFWVTTTLQTYKLYTDAMKDVVALVEAPQQNVFQGGSITAFTYYGEYFASGVTLDSPGNGSYHPNDILTIVGGAGVPSQFRIASTQVVSATVSAPGSGGTNGPVTITGTTGTGTKFQATGTIAGGSLSGPLTIINPGSYTVNPNLTGDPVNGGGLVGATVALQTGGGTLAGFTPGAMHTLPPDPTPTTASPAGGTGLTVSVLWQPDMLMGQIVVTTATPHGVSPGDLFQIQGMVPTTYNTFYVAQPGTGGTTLVASMYTDPGPATVLGTVLPSYVVSSRPPSSEMTIAKALWEAVHINPSSSNKVAPFAFRYLFGATNWVQKGNGAILQALKDSSINYVATGAEGGISNSCLFFGTVREPTRDFTYWYSIDWAQINSELALANVIINGSNNPINPLYYDQRGIDRLQDAVVATMQSAVAFGLANGVPTRSSLSALAFTDAFENGQFDGKLNVNAEPLSDYLADNPSDYKIGRYAGLSVSYIPMRGFISVIFNINVTDFVVA